MKLIDENTWIRCETKEELEKCLELLLEHYYELHPDAFEFFTNIAKLKTISRGICNFYSCFFLEHYLSIPFITAKEFIEANTPKENPNPSDNYTLKDAHIETLKIENAQLKDELTKIRQDVVDLHHRFTRVYDRMQDVLYAD
jgi:hypothetical protein